MKKMFLMLGCLLQLQMQAYINVGELWCISNNNNEISDNKRSFGCDDTENLYKSNYDYLSKKLTTEAKDGKNKKPNTTIAEKEKTDIGNIIKKQISKEIDLIEKKIEELEKKNEQVNQEQCLKFLKKGGLVNLFFHVIENVKLLDEAKKECTYRCFCQDFVPVDRGTNHSLADENSSREVKYLFSCNNGEVNCFEFASPVYYDQLNPGNYIVQDGKIIQRQQNQKQLNEEFITLNDIRKPFTEYCKPLDPIKKNFWGSWIKKLCETLNNKLWEVEFDKANDENREAKKNKAITETISDMSQYTAGEIGKMNGSGETEEKTEKSAEMNGSGKTEKKKKKERKSKEEYIKDKKAIAQEILNDLTNIEKKIQIEDTLRSMQINTNNNIQITDNNVQAFEVPQKIELDNGDFGKIIKELKNYIDRLKQILDGKVTDFYFEPPKNTENKNVNKVAGTKTDNKVEDKKTENAEVKLDSYCITITYDSKEYRIFIKTDSSDEYKQCIRISTVMRK